MLPTPGPVDETLTLPDSSFKILITAFMQFIINDIFVVSRNITETWTHLYPLILNLSIELLTFVLSSERRGK